MTAAARAPKNAAGGRGALGLVHKARRDMALDEDTYRDVLERVTGQRTAAGLTDRQLGLVLDAFKAKGWKPRVIAGSKKAAAPAQARRRADHPVARKARALWISLHQLGVVVDPSESALEKFAKRQLGVDRLQWAPQAHGNKLIEALKAMAERAGWDQSGSLDEVLARLDVLLGKRDGQ